MTSSRTLRSKALRGALYEGANGRCQLCGSELDERWHADHRESWRDRQETNVHDMWALCSKCNLQKGARSMPELRSHQRELRDRAVAVAGGVIGDRKTVASVTPGGGKTYAALLFAKPLMEAGLVNRIAWVCPRSSLAKQCEESAAGFPGITMRRADNTAPLVRAPANGYATTYQAIGTNPALHAAEFRRGRYLLVLDEPHHLADDEKASWHRAVQPLVNAASHTLLMTGTIERHDGKRIPFVDYETRDGRSFPVEHVTYTLRDAYAEHAVLPIEFSHHDSDGAVRWLTDKGERAATLSESEDALRAFIEHAGPDLVRRGIDDWLYYRTQKYQSRAIVVCARQPEARAIAKLISSEYQVQVALAISDEDDAQRTIKQFRRNERGEVLVTVGMAYEGLDVPDCTHLVCLTDTRSEPWLRQAFARVTRVAAAKHGCRLPYERQCAFIYTPDDPRMREVVARMQDEQARGLEERERRESSAAETERQQSIYIGLDAALGTATLGTAGQRFSDDDTAFIERVRRELPDLKSESASALLRLVKDYGTQRDHEPASERTLTLSDQEAEKRKAIDKLTRSIDGARRRALDGWEWGNTNKLIWQRFRKNREEMSLAELDEVLGFLMDLRRGDAAE